MNCINGYQFSILSTDINWINQYQLYQPISTVSTVINCFNSYQLYQQLSTVSTVINCFNSYQLYQQLSTVSTVINCFNSYQLYQQLSTVSTVINCFNSYQLYQQLSTVSTVINCINSYRLYQPLSTVTFIHSHFEVTLSECKQVPMHSYLSLFTFLELCIVMCHAIPLKRPTYRVFTIEVENYKETMSFACHLKMYVELEIVEFSCRK